MARVEAPIAAGAAMTKISASGDRAAPALPLRRSRGDRRGTLELRPTADRTCASAFEKSPAACSARQSPSTPPASESCSLSGVSKHDDGRLDCVAAPWRTASAMQKRRHASGSSGASTGEGASDDDSTQGPPSLSSGASWPRRSPTESLDGSSSESELGDDEVSPGALLVYPIAMLLAARAAFAVGAASLSRAARGARPCSMLGYSVRAEAELPECLARTTSAPSSAAAASSVEAEAEDERILRAARSILNKLTVEKFDALYEQLATCGISTEAQLRSVVCEVFEKATAQHHFIPMYADLCVRLESEERIVIAQEAVSEAVGRSDQFRRLLLNRCQSAFEELLAPERSSAGEGEDDEARLVRKQRALGSVRLVGQLLLRGMLSSRLMVHCAQDLLEARSRCAGALEFLAAFLTVVCPAFDTPRFALHAQLQAILHRLEELAGDKASVSPRERCLLRDLLDLRAAGWAGRHSAAKPSAPMRLEAVRAEAAAEGVVASPQRPRAPLSGASSSMPSSPAWSRSPAAACGRPWQRSSHAHAGATPQATPQQQRAKARRAPGEGQAVAAAAPQCPAAGVKQASTPEAAVVSAGRGVEAATSVAPARGPSTRRPSVGWSPRR